MRLLTAKDYSLVFGKSRRLSDRYWTVLVHESPNRYPRLGLAVAKKRAKRAVDRNRIKRIARETIRCRQKHLSGKDLIIMNRNETAKASSKQLRVSLDKLLGRLD